MLDTSIHDPVNSRLHVGAKRCECMWRLIDEADLFVDAAQVYLSAHAANLSHAATVPPEQLMEAMRRAVSLYEQMERTNMDEFVLPKHGGFANVETLAAAIRTSSPVAENAWFMMLEIFKGNALDRVVLPFPGVDAENDGTRSRRARRDTIALFK